MASTPLEPIDALGNIYALGGATVWAVSSLLFARTRMSPFALNLAKNVVAVIAFALTLGAIGLRNHELPLHADASTFGILAASAVIGLVIGDWCHFRALRLLGARKALVLETLAPIFAAGIAFAWLRETLSLPQLLGIVATLAGVALVVGEAHGGERELSARERWVGGVFGMLAAVGQAAGATLSSHAIDALKREPGATYAALEASALRLVVAAACGMAIAAIMRGPRAEARALARDGQWGTVIPAALLATYVGVWLSLLAFEHTRVAIAQTLLSLSPVFVLPLVRFIFDERLSARAIVGAVVSVGGTALLFLT